MELINILYLGNYFIQFIFITIIIGVLIFEYSRRKDKKGVLLYAVSYCLLLLVNIFDVYQEVFGAISPIIITILLAMATFHLVLFLWGSIKMWRFLNKVLFFGIIFFVIIISILRGFFSELTGIYLGEIIILLNFLSIIFHYFFIISFLINSKDTKLKKREKKR